jgi:tetratricopeptide (TPR) repeat protein
MILILAAAIAAAQAPAAKPACPDVVTSEAFVCRALQASNSGDADTAAQAFEQAANAKTDNEIEKARLWAAAGNMWIAANQPGKAAIALDKALAGPGLEAEQRGEALLDRARAAETQDDLKTARSKIEEAKRSVADDPFLWYFSAALAMREGDTVTAKSAIGQALSMAPNDATILFEAGHVYHFAGDTAAARTYWSRAAAADANGKTGKAARDALALLDAPPAEAQKPRPKP